MTPATTNTAAPRKRKLTEKRAEQVRRAQAAFRLRKKMKLAELELKVSLMSKDPVGNHSDHNIAHHQNFTGTSSSTSRSASPYQSHFSNECQQRDAAGGEVPTDLDLSDTDAVAAFIKNNPGLRETVLKQTPLAVRKVLQVRFAQRNFWLRKENRIKELEKQVLEFEQVVRERSQETVSPVPKYEHAVLPIPEVKQQEWNYKEPVEYKSEGVRLPGFGELMRSLQISYPSPPLQPHYHQPRHYQPYQQYSNTFTY
ncbi:hypothetical protein BCR33DRAFT_767419 [Rhizoclosmatium globosum]|uniref:BZIP domain-containing protein n=1 Tax=Rhizoclosmatium globosum TaxID=329046 RepID=A0A1Y2C3G4_9FUNG|nr:hypothetical protein BCR33DRAFT_767419 [Rhizoclosmatium globosum]|eukprot:ORY41568.1 hypothetical protein BCR33DRAFT_767419 [Rhizoclosmatium globosum]